MSAALLKNELLYCQEFVDQMITTDVLIAGAGPAGSVCGSLLHKNGIDCLLIDVEKNGENVIEVELSQTYDVGLCSVK